MNWFYAIDNQQHGPVDEDRLHELARSGDLKEDDLIWTEGMEQWQPAHTVDGLAFPMAPQTVSDDSQSASEHLHESDGGFFSYQGRTNRLKYFWQVMALGLVWGITQQLLLLTEEYQLYLVFLTLFSFLWSFPIVHRLHDLDLPGGWYWLSVAPIVPFVLGLQELGYAALLINFAWGLYLLFAKGTEGPNKYGPDPLRSQTREPATATVAKRQPSHANTSSS